MRKSTAFFRGLKIYEHRFSSSARYKKKTSLAANEKKSSKGHLLSLMSCNGTTLFPFGNNTIETRKARKFILLQGHDSGGGTAQNSDSIKTGPSPISPPRHIPHPGYISFIITLFFCPSRVAKIVQVPRFFAPPL